MPDSTSNGSGLRYNCGVNAIDAMNIEILRRNAARSDFEVDWPVESWNVVGNSNVLQWCLPKRFGGMERSPGELLLGYGGIAAHCLTTAFILSQREAATRYLLRGGNDALIDQIVPYLVDGRKHITLGISQLTTSRQFGKPAMQAVEIRGGFRVSGIMPWVTAADHADDILAGAALSDGRQFLAIVPRNSPGLSIGPPLELLAVRGSRTAAVRADDVFVPNDHLAVGPIENLMASMKGGTGGLETTALALGLTMACASWIRDEIDGSHRSDINEWLVRMETRRAELTEEMIVCANENGNNDAIAQLRGAANQLVSQSADTVMALAKGSGFVHPHPAERFVRQARFFLVWSSPKPAVDATLLRIWKQ